MSGVAGRQDVDGRWSLDGGRWEVVEVECGRVCVVASSCKPGVPSHEGNPPPTSLGDAHLVTGPRKAHLRASVRSGNPTPSATSASPHSAMLPITGHQ